MKYLTYIIPFFLICTLQLFAQSKLVISKTNGTSVDIDLADIKKISFVSNLVKNSDFSDSFNHWILIGNTTNPYHPEDPGRANFTTENGIAEISITNQGTSIWSIMLYQNVYFEKGATYVISFDAKSELPREIISNVCQDGGEWTNYSGDFKFNLTNSLTNFSYEFKMSVEGMQLFQFCLGTAGTGKLYFDNIVIRKKM